MKNLMQCALGDDWHKLPPALQAHYRYGDLTEAGFMDIEFPWFMQPFLSVLRLFGALVNSRGKNVPTLVEKNYKNDTQHWKRTITYPNGKVIYFYSALVAAEENQLIEYTNSIMGLQMSVHVADGKLHYSGVRFVFKLGTILLPIPEWLLLGHTTITETAVDETHFAMDFRLTHPLFGQIFRYAGSFKVDCA